VTIKIDNNDKSYTLILKIPTVDKWNDMSIKYTEAELEQNKKYILEMHNTECDVYDMIKHLEVSLF
jgi:hypothetical protein